MEQILILRELTISYFKRYERTVIFIAKFIAGIYIFSGINSINLYHPILSNLFSAPVAFPFLLLMGVLFVVSPPTLACFFIVLQITVQMSQSLEAAAFVFLLLCLILIFYVRLAPQNSYLMIALIIGFHLRMPYAVVIFAGLYVGIAAIVPIAAGTAVWCSAPFFIRLVGELKTSDKIDITAMPQNFITMFQTIFDALTGNFNWIIIAFIFAVVVLGVYAVTLLTFDYAKEIAVAFGGVACIICLMMAALVVENFQLSILSIFLGSIASVCIVGAIRFFDCVLDYRRTERVQFEDDDNYYYVKVVPKITLAEKEPERPRAERNSYAGGRRPRPRG